MIPIRTKQSSGDLIAANRPTERVNKKRWRDVKESLCLDFSRLDSVEVVTLIKMKKRMM